MPNLKTAPFHWKNQKATGILPVHSFYLFIWISLLLFSGTRLSVHLSINVAVIWLHENSSGAHMMENWQVVTGMRFQVFWLVDISWQSLRHQSKLYLFPLRINCLDVRSLETLAIEIEGETAIFPESFVFFRMNRVLISTAFFRQEVILLSAMN